MSSTDQALQSYEDINFEGIDDDLAAFQEDDMVQQALQRGVDLKKYGGDLGNDLKKVKTASLQRLFALSIFINQTYCPSAGRTRFSGSLHPEL